MKIKIIYFFSGFILLFNLYFFMIPLGFLVYDLNDAGLANGQIPRFTYRWHQNISKGFATWAKNRITSKKALSANTVSSTEWPMFSAAYFLWSTETLQQQWEKDPSLSAIAPKIYAKSAIKQAVELIIDPNNAAWVKLYWGENYLYHENVFYRMLLMAGLTSYQQLTGDTQYQLLLKKQINSLAQELDASPYGLLDDYPDACYPVDILPAIAIIQRADKLLGMDHSLFIKRSIRAFQEGRLDKETKLPAYIADSKTGQALDVARGVGLSYMLIWAPELWAEQSELWYQRYQKLFWKQGEIISGVKELATLDLTESWFVEVDSGPVIFGYGTAASAFGIGAARANNQFEQAYPLATEALVAAWPLADGTLLIPRLLSNLSDAPYLGETALLFNMTRMPVINKTQMTKEALPPFVWLFLLFYGLCSILLGIFFIKLLKKAT